MTEPFQCPDSPVTVEYVGIFARTVYWRCKRSDAHDHDDRHEWVRSSTDPRASQEQK